MALQASGLDSANVVHRPRLLSNNGSSYIGSRTFIVSDKRSLSRCLLRTWSNHLAGERKDQETNHRKTPLGTRAGGCLNSNLNEQEPPLNQKATCLKDCDDGQSSHYRDGYEIAS
jgi:hypothetical protein